MTLTDPAVKEPEFIRLIKYSAGAPGEAPVLRETWLPAEAGPRNASQGYGSTRKMSAQAPVPFPHLFTGHPLLPLLHPALPMTTAWRGTKAVHVTSGLKGWIDLRKQTIVSSSVLFVLYLPFLQLLISDYAVSHNALAIILRNTDIASHPPCMQLQQSNTITLTKSVQIRHSCINHHVC